MAETQLRARDPLSMLPLEPVPGLRLSASKFTQRFICELDASGMQSLVKSSGLSEVPAMNRATIGDGIALLRIAPDELLCLFEGLESASEPIFRPKGGIEISHGWVGLHAKGAGLLLTMASACPLDLDERAFPIGMATRTLFGKHDVILWRQAQDSFNIELGRSYLAGFLAFFVELARCRHGR